MRALLLLGVGAAGCSTIFGFKSAHPYDTDDGGSTGADAGARADADTSKFAIASTTPLDSATGAQRDTVPTVTFDRTLDSSTIAGITMTVDGAPATVTVNLDAPTAISIHHAKTFPLLATCVLTIPTTVHDTAGEGLAAPARISFQVRDGTWTTPHLLDSFAATGTLDARNPLVGLDDAGDAEAIWEQDFSGGVTWMDFNAYVGGAWAAASVIDSSPNNESSGALVVTPAGTALAAYNDSGPQVRGASATVGGAWSVNTLQNMLADHPPAIGRLDAYWSVGGTLWSVPIAGGAPNGPFQSGITSPIAIADTPLATRLLFATGALVMSDDLQASPVGISPETPTSLAVASGNGVFIGGWTTGAKVRGALLPGTVFDIDTNATASDLSLVADATGLATAIWRRHDTSLPATDTVWASSAPLSDTSAWTPVRIDHLDGGVATEPYAVISSTGEIAVVWVDAGAGVHVIRFIHGAWELDKEIVASGRTNVAHPRIAVEALGEAIVVWQETVSSHLVIEASELN
jgi:hypothetical protein